MIDVTRRFRLWHPDSVWYIAWEVTNGTGLPLCYRKLSSSEIPPPLKAKLFSNPLSSGAVSTAPDTSEHRFRGHYGKSPWTISRMRDLIQITAHAPLMVMTLVGVRGRRRLPRGHIWYMLVMMQYDEPGEGVMGRSCQIPFILLPNY